MYPSPFIPFVLGRALAGSAGVVDESAKNKIGVLMMFLPPGPVGAVLGNVLAKREAPDTALRATGTTGTTGTVAIAATPAAAGLTIGALTGTSTAVPPAASTVTTTAGALANTPVATGAAAIAPTRP